MSIVVLKKIILGCEIVAVDASNVVLKVMPSTAGGRIIPRTVLLQPD